MSRAAPEKIVRPFEQGDVFTARVDGPSVIVDPPGSVVIEWVGSADTDYVEEPEPGFIGIEVKWEEDKSQRQTSTVRIKNKDDPEQFVDIERIDKMVLKEKNTGETIPIKMDWSS